MPYRLRYVIWGILAGGIPGFRIGLLLSPFCRPGVAFVLGFLFCLFFCGHTKCDDTRMSPLVSIPHGLIGYHHSLWFVLLVVFCLVCCCFPLALLLFWSDGPLEHVQESTSPLLCLSFSRRPCMLICKFRFCLAIEYVERPGESYEGVGGKKPGRSTRSIACCKLGCKI